METTVRDAVLTALRGLRLMDFDWDGARGLPMRADVADLACDLFDSLDALDDLTALPMPTVTLNGNGTVETAFDGDDGRQLLLTYECEGVITYIKVFPDEQTTVEGVIRLGPNALHTTAWGDLAAPDEFAEFLELLTWVADPFGDEGD